MAHPGEPTATRLDFDFDFDFDETFCWGARLFGVHPANARLSVDTERLSVCFGPWRVETPVSNVAGAEVTGPYRWPRVFGPARLTLHDRGLTFATNARRGVCISFNHPVPGIEPTGVVRHPNLTVTVSDGARLADVILRLVRRNRDFDPARVASEATPLGLLKPP
jgi:hypothetical protein